MSIKYFPIHNHSEYSILDGIPKMKDYAKYISENKQSFQQALCITDHGTMLGCVDQYNSAKKYGLKPVFGVELYIANDFPAVEKPKRYHLVLIAKNRRGYEQIISVMNRCIKENLILVSVGKNFTITNTQILKDIFSEEQDNVYCSTACLQSYVFDDFNENKLREIIQIFGKNNVFVEYQTFLDSEMRQSKINDLGKKSSLKYGLKTIITADSHAILKEHLKYWKTLTAINFKMTLRMFEEKYGRNSSYSNYFKKPEDFLEELRFADFMISEKDALQAFETTNEIFESIEEFSINREQTFVYCDDANSRFLETVKTGWKEKIAGKVSDIKKYHDRLKYEVDIIKQKGFIGYTLAVSDVLKECEKAEVAVGSGRGSGAGSLVNYLTGITNVDPLKYNLLFSRYLNIARKDFPDIDSDVSDREKCVNIIKNMFPEKEITVIANKNRMQLKKLVKTMYKVYDICFPKTDSTYIENSDFCSKLIDTYAIEDVNSFFSLSELKGVKEYCSQNLKLDIQELFDLFYDNLDSLGLHAGGVCMLSKNQTNVPYVPVKGEAYDFATAYSESAGLTELEQVGEIKFDFLGLKTLTLIEKCLKTISKVNNIPFKQLYDDIAKMKKVDLNDPKVYDLINSFQTQGMFQIGSKGMIEFINLIKPNNIEELSMLVALYRPGPMQSGMQMKVEAVKFNKKTYLDIWNEKSDGSYVDYSEIIKVFEDIIQPTYYSVIYEEQVMQIGQRIADYDDSELNNFRKFLKTANKTTNENDEKKKRFYGAFMENGLKKGFKKNVLEDLWEKLVNFSAYSFNKSHALSYSLTTFITAYLSTYYPIEWYTTLLNHESLVEFLPIVKFQIAKRNLNIKIISPKLDECFEHATCVKNKNEIVIGILQVKGITEVAAKELSEFALKNIKFKTFESFLNSCEYDRKKLNKTVLERLIDIGFFDNLDNDRLKLRIMYDDFRCGKLVSKKKTSMDSFMGLKKEEIPNLSNRKLDFLKESEAFFDSPELYFVKREIDLIGLMIGFTQHPFSTSAYEKYRGRFKSEKGDEKILFVNNIEEVKVKTRSYSGVVYTYYVLILKIHNGRALQVTVNSDVLARFNTSEFKYDIMDLNDRKKSMILSYSDSSKPTESTKLRLLYLEKKS